MGHNKDHARLLHRVSRILGTSYFETVHVAVAISSPDTPPSEDKDVARRLLNEFMDTHVFPSYIEDFFLDIVLGRIIVTDKTGKVVNPLRGGYYEPQAKATT